MDYSEKHNILNKWFKDKWIVHLPTCIVGHSPSEYNNYKPYLAIYTENWVLWDVLLTKYSYKQLSEYMLEIIRIKLPQLKGSQLYIYNFNGINNIILNLSKVESDKHLYII